MLKKGDTAPSVILKDQNGNDFDIKSLGEKKIILYFYPKDDTPGCTNQACNLRDNYKKLLESGFAIVGISADNIHSHKKFAEKYQLPFTLLADPDHLAISAYGVWGKKSMYGKSYEGLHRTTFIINEKGIIDEVIHQVKTTDHSKQIFKIYT